MTYKIISALSFSNQITEIAKHIVKDNGIQTKNKEIGLIFESIDQLTDFPFLGTYLTNSIFRGSKRRKLITKNGYIVIYDVHEIAKCVYLIAIYHPSQNYERYL